MSHPSDRKDEPAMFASYARVGCDAARLDCFCPLIHQNIISRAPTGHVLNSIYPLTDRRFSSVTNRDSKGIEAACYRGSAGKRSCFKRLRVRPRLLKDDGELVNKSHGLQGLAHAAHI